MFKSSVFPRAPLQSNLMNAQVYSPDEADQLLVLKNVFFIIFFFITLIGYLVINI